MDDIADKISSLLNSPDGMEKLKSAAQSLLGGQEKEETNDNINISGLGNMLSGMQMPDNMGALMEAAKAMSAGQNDPRVKLLLALKPHLSEARAERVDKAVRILQLVSVAPLISKSGLF